MKLEVVMENFKYVWSNVGILIYVFNCEFYKI